jgi:dCMP deaminase
MTDWNARFMDLATHVAGWSRDPSTKVGAVIVDGKNLVVGLGYNGFPRGVKDLKERYDDRATKYKYVVHAEPNAILNSTRDVRGCVLYCTLHPCGECAKIIIQAGIAAVFCKPADPRWAESSEIAARMFAEAGVDLFIDQAGYMCGGCSVILGSKPAQCACGYIP